MCSLYFQTLTNIDKFFPNNKIKLLPGINNYLINWYGDKTYINIWAVKAKKDEILIMKWNKNDDDSGGTSRVNRYNLKNKQWVSTPYDLFSEKIMKTLSHADIEKLHPYPQNTHIKPVILFLQSPWDENNAFDKYGDKGLFLIFKQFPKYTVKHHYINNVSEMMNIIKKSPKIAHLIIMAHGSQNSIRLSQNHSFTVKDMPAFAKVLNKKLLPHSSIFLHSCSVGKGGPGKKNFAQALANNLSNHIVFGADKKIMRDTVDLMSISTNGTLKINYQFALDVNNKMYRFKKILAPLRKSRKRKSRKRKIYYPALWKILKRKSKKHKVNAKDELGRTALMIAVENSDEDMVKTLLKVKGIKVNAKDEDGWTALMNAALYGRKEIVQILLNAKGIKVNAKNEDGWTALMMSVFNGHKDIMKILLNANGIKVNAKDKYGETALTRACISNDKDIVRLLLNAGANVDARDEKCVYDKFGFFKKTVDEIFYFPVGFGGGYKFT